MSQLHLFILNPAAGKHDQTGELTRAIRKLFESDPVLQGAPYEIAVTRGEGDATVIAELKILEHPEGIRIYACGGDGTLNEVVCAAAEKENASVCPVPVGSGNDFIKYFEEIPRTRFLDLRSCALGEAIPCDLMKVAGRYCLNIASVGLDAITAARQQKVKRIPMVSGSFAYKIALFYSFLSAMKNPIRLEVDGEEAAVGNGNVAIAAAGNGRFYGGGFKATPTANISDGCIDFIAIPTISRFKFLKYVRDYQKGLHMESMKDFLFYRRCKRVRMLSPKPLVVQADGEIFHLKDPEITVVPGALNLILPVAQDTLDT
ncbi:MAG: hypothetical protein J6Z79_04835 [Clostridia bacterium]|nr:hypothetical protein [Clostridia bacterium]